VKPQKGPDEYIGLPSAFLHAGAAKVILSLWPIDDCSTGLLMKKMYRLMKEGRGKAEALNLAQLWPKDPENVSEHLEPLDERSPSTTRRAKMEQKPVADRPAADYVHAHYWAGFICSGVD
jgi:CHAT domain-containing protein